MLLSGGDADLVLGFAVLLDLEAGFAGEGDIAIGKAADSDGVVAEGGVVGEGKITIEGAVGGDGQVLVDEGFLLIVGDGDMNLRELRQDEGVAGVLAKDGLPVDGVPGAIDGAIGVDEAGVGDAAGHGEAAEVGGNEGDVGALAGDDPHLAMVDAVVFGGGGFGGGAGGRGKLGGAFSVGGLVG